GADSVTVALDALPPDTLVGLRVSDCNTAAGGGGAGVTVNVVVFVTPAYVADNVVDVVCETVEVAIPKFAELAPCAMVTLAGTVTALLALDNEMTAPLLGAPDESVTVPVEALPPATELGLALIEASAAAPDGGFHPS